MSSSSQINKYKFDNICRLCLTRKSDRDLINIFDNDEHISLSLRIMACTAIEIQQNDTIPKTICTECRYQLEKSYYFRKKSKNSDTKLRRHIRLINAGKKSKIDNLDDKDNDNIDDDDEDYEESLSFFAKKDEEEKKKQNELKLLHELKNEELLKLQIEEERKRIRNEETKRIIEEVRVKILNEIKPAKPPRKQTFAKPKLISHNAIIASKSLPINKNMQHTVYEVTGDICNDEIESINIKKLFEDDQLINGDCKYDENNEKFNIQTEYSYMQSNTGTNDGDNEHDDDDDEHDDDDGAEEADNDNFAISLSTQNKKKDQYILSDDAEIEDNTKIKDEVTVEYLNDSNSEMEYESNMFELRNENYISKNSDNENEEKTLDNYDDECSNEYIEDEDEMQIKEIGRKSDDKVTKVEVTTADGEIVVVELNTETNNQDEVDENGELKIFHCKVCPASFSRRVKLLRHIPTHLVKEGCIRVCSICNKSFPSNSALARHERIHTGEKPFKCDICQRTFVQKEILKRHTRIHTGIKPFSCALCNKSFTQKDVLRQHINRKHTDNPIVACHKCPLCTKAFCHASGLSRHLLIHAGKRYTCQYCERHFNDNSALKRHIVTIHI